MKINLLKKELVIGIICILIFMSFPTTLGNDSQSGAILNEDLVVIVTTDKEIYYLGEPVIITISVTNYGPNTTLEFSTSKQTNFKVTKPYGRHVYRWAWHCFFLPVLTYVELKQGETKVLCNLTWHKLRDFYPIHPVLQIPVLPGKYIITGWIVGGTHPKITGEPVEVTIRWSKFI